MLILSSKATSCTYGTRAAVIHPRVDGKPVKQVTLKHGDVIQFGTVVFEVRKSANPIQRPPETLQPDQTLGYDKPAGHPTILAGVAQLILERRLEAQEPETRSEQLKR